MESNLFISSNKYEYSPMVNLHKVSLLNVIFQNLSSEVDIKLFFNQLNYSYDKVEGELGGRGELEEEGGEGGGGGGDQTTEGWETPKLS